MRALPPAFLLALALDGCAGSGPPGTRSPELLSDDLEPAVTQVTAGRSGADRDPEISRDGRLLFYASTAHGESYDLYVKSVGSNTTTRLTPLAGDKRFPRVSPANPRMIAFCSNDRGSWELRLIEDYVDAPSKSVVLSDPGTDNLHPSWSPDGRKLVYCSTHDRAAGEWVLKIKDLATGKTHVLEDVDGLLPDWSPAGNRIVFQRMKRRDDWLSSIWTLDFENGAARNVTSIFSSDDWAAIHPAWSPDGSRVAFATAGKSRARAGVMYEADDLWIVGADGMNPMRITSSPAANGMPSWSPDGRIYFVSDRSGGPRIWSLAAP
jgi:TolB protein